MVTERSVEERPYRTSNRVRMMGRTSEVAECPFCGRSVVIYLWAIAGNGKKKCPCGAALHDDRVARKLVEMPANPNHAHPGRDADGEPGNVSE